MKPVLERAGHRVLWVSMWLARIWLWPVTRLMSLCKSRGPLPPIRNHLLTLSATKLAVMIRNRQVECVDVVQAYIQRISEIRQPLNCVVQDRFKEAMEEAVAVDEMIKQNPDPVYWEKAKPLLGVPLTVKESIAVKGLSHCTGMVEKEVRVACEDAPCVARARDAGAIVLLVSNTPELCMSYETFNKVTGMTNNPYDLRRTCGGSSGGEASLLGGAGSVIGVGSDTAGSSRLPALFCGVYGHKPTPGLISSKGHRPACKDEQFDNFFTIAPMSRYAEDLPLLLRNLITDPDREVALNLDKPVDLKKLKIYYMESDGTIISNKVHKELKKSMRNVLKHFETKYDIVPQKLELKELNDVWKTTIVVMMRMKGIDSVFSKSEEDPDEWKSVTKEFLKFFTGCSKHTLPALLFGPLKKYAQSRSQKSFDNMLQYKRDLMTKMAEILGDDGVFFFPAFYDLANFHYQFYYKLLNVNYLTVFNLLELPATVCPLGLAKDGRPLGIQIAVNKNQDRLSFAVARELEDAFGGWVPPPQTEPELQTV